MYNYPAMLAHSADMAGYADTLQSLSADIASEQAALHASWQGETGLSYQAWQAQWNQAAEQLVLAYRAMASTHENNTTSMLAATQPKAPNGAAKDRARAIERTDEYVTAIDRLDGYPVPTRA
jgi:WXG100 family type VII secretion target